MEFKDYYAALGVAPDATQDQIKRAYRKLARQYHPDVSQEANAEARFKEVAEAHEALIDVERRAAYDDIVQRHARGQPFEPPPGWDSGFEYSGRPARGDGHDSEAFSAFFESLFGRAGPHEMPRRGTGGRPRQGDDHHARVAIRLLDAWHGAQRMITLHTPVIDGTGRASLQDRQLEVSIPKGVRAGQRLRLAGQGAPGQGDAPAGDLFLEIQFLPHPVFRVEGADVYFDLPVAPWEAALGATVTAPTPAGSVALAVPAGSSAGRRLRLKGRGLPGKPPGDLYAMLTLALPAAATASEQLAYSDFARAFPAFDARAALAAMAGHTPD